MVQNVSKFNFSYSSERIVVTKINIIDTVETVNGRVELIEQIILLQVEVCSQKVITLVLSLALAEGGVEEIFFPLMCRVRRAAGQSDGLAFCNFVCCLCRQVLQFKVGIVGGAGDSRDSGEGREGGY